jgi:amino acid transporter
MGAKAHPKSKRKTADWWMTQHKVSNALALFGFPIMCGKVIDDGRATSSIFTAMAFAFGANCTMKKWNMKRVVEDGGTVDRVILGLSDKDAKKVMVYCELFINNFTGDPRGNTGKYVPVKSVPFILIWFAPFVLPYLLHGTTGETYGAGGIVLVVLFHFANLFSINYSAGATTFCTFMPCAYAMKLRALTYADFLHDLWEIDEEGLALKEEDMEVELLEGGEGRGFGASSDMEKLNASIEAFNKLKATSREFSNGFQNFFVVAEFILIPAFVLAGFVVYQKLHISVLDTRDVCIVAIGSIHFILSISISIGLFLHGVAVTTALEKATHTVEQVRDKNLLKAELAEGPSGMLFRKQLEVFHRHAVESELGFVPYKIRIESRLAVTIFYVLVSIGLTIYIEIVL